MPENDELLRLAKELTPFDLPIGVYVVTVDGQFRACNRRAREIFNLPPDGDLTDFSIGHYYDDPTKREKIHKELERAEAKGSQLEKLLPLKINGGEIVVRDYSRSVKDKDGNVLGYVCCVTDVTEEVRSRRLLDALPAGVYKLDANDHCEAANDAFARILGFDSADEIEGEPSSRFYVNQRSADELRSRVEAEHPEPVTNFIAEMCRKDGDRIFVNINAHMVLNDEGGYGGREGTLFDVTSQELYRRIFQRVPVGLNVVRHEGDQDLLEDCNEEFLALFDFPYSDPTNARGFNVRQLHASDEEYTRFRKELDAAAKANRTLERHRLKVRTLDGNKKTIEITTKPIIDEDGKVIGRTGAMYDISQEAELRDRLDKLTYDIGSVLHNYTTMLLMTQLSTTPIIRSLAPDPFPTDREITPEQANDAVATPAMRLAGALGQLLNLAKEEGRHPALSEEKWQRLGHLRDVLRNYKNIDEVDAHSVVLEEAALEIIDSCELLLQSHRFSRESVVNVRNEAQSLLRLTSLISLHQVRDAVVEMDHQVRSLREFVTTNARQPEQKELCEIGALIKQVRSNLDNYARARRIKFKLELKEANVKVVRREVVRALTDLLHNAIKYSWQRDRTKSPWIKIRTFIADEEVHVEFQNWGVPVRQEEIDRELIFKIGYRGMHSGDRGRVGTGIGLADARQVARAHQGDLDVSSQPAVGSWAPDDYSNPFITTVTLRLPAYQVRSAR